jgi:uncharacterized protein YijF (DUF1287 family)
MLRHLRSILRLLCVVAVMMPIAATAARAAGNHDLVSAARAQVGETLIYDPGYQRLDYPMGDVPRGRGVCSDVVIRSLRAVDVDLQVLVHQDMKKNFADYPPFWGLDRPDRNIDHRRVPNLAAYLTRQGKAVPVTAVAADYQPGDIVAWRLASGRPHIGIVSDALAANGEPLIIHNIGWGTREESGLFDNAITGHFRWFP